MAVMYLIGFNTMKKLLMCMCLGVFLGCASEAPRQEINQRAASVAVVKPSQPKPTLRQAVPAARLKTPSRALTVRVPASKLLQKNFVLPRATPGAI